MESIDMGVSASMLVPRAFCKCEHFSVLIQGVILISGLTLDLLSGPLVYIIGWVFRPKDHGGQPCIK
jgi:hypothetical protein